MIHALFLAAMTVGAAVISAIVTHIITHHGKRYGMAAWFATRRGVYSVFKPHGVAPYGYKFYLYEADKKGIDVRASHEF